MLASEPDTQNTEIRLNSAGWKTLNVQTPPKVPKPQTPNGDVGWQNTKPEKGVIAQAQTLKRYVAGKTLNLKRNGRHKPRTTTDGRALHSPNPKQNAVAYLTLNHSKVCCSFVCHARNGYFC